MSEPETKIPASPSETATDASGGGSAAPQNPSAGGADLAAQLAAAKAEAAASLDKFLRTAADLENFRRRTVREKEDLRTAATGRVLEDIFPVLDTLGLAITAAKQPNADLKTLVGGVDMVLTQLKTALANHGLKEINPAGQAFDPHQHEAISHAPSAEVKEEHVVTVVRTGYSLNGRLLRPASVVISSGPAK
ncbi:MAG: nucleotide exchange factor GrpE [Opitutia bacterium Tous-C1TDCM]|nr:MAG: nucleotide exchange factor GrpE [Opitutae bacterium Tous-C1TDCM]